MDSTTSLWRTYFFIVISSVFAATAILYIEWLEIVNDSQNELVYTNKLMAKSVQSNFRKNEGLLRILGERLVELGALTLDSPESKKLVDDLLKNNPDMAGLGLADTSGQLVLTSFNIDRSKLPNLLNSPESSLTFKQSLKSDQMILGHVYFMKALQSWVVPLRLRVLGPDGHVIAVMTTGLKLNSTNNLWSDINLAQHINVQILRKDFYYLYSPIRFGENIAEVYGAPIRAEYIDDFKQAFTKTTSKSFDVLNQSEGIYLVNGYAGKERFPVIFSISYNDRYQIYTLLATPYSLLYKKLFLPAFLVFVLLLIYASILYWVFSGIIRIQLASKMRLRFQAMHDPLTLLPNRRYLLNEFSDWQKQSDNKFYLIFIDLNNFKSSNDLYGHTIGDLILKEVSVRLKNNFPDCLVTRHGGDEFIVLSPNSSPLDILTLCENFLEQLKQPIIIDELDFSIGASVGVSYSPDDGTELDELQRKADMAMYEAKRDDADVNIFSAKLEEKQKYKVIIERELRHALDRKEFYLVYQPQVDSVNQNFIGAEVLLRWKNKELGLVSPEEFISIAEEKGLMIDIGKFVLEQSIVDFSKLADDLGSKQKQRLSINISLCQLLHFNFIKYLKEISNKYQSDNISIVLEVTESLFIEDLERARLILDEIKKIGMDISLDDFGTGYSSLSVLSHLPINELKIDKSFVRDILIDENDRNLIEGIINLSKSLKIPVIAEGVEEQEQSELLFGFGCDLFQGYYYSKPLILKDLKAFIKNNLKATEQL